MGFTSCTEAVCLMRCAYGTSRLWVLDVCGSDSCKATAGDHAKNGNTGSTKEISSEFSTDSIRLERREPDRVEGVVIGASTEP